MATCTCGATLPADAKWCQICYKPVAGAPVAGAPPAVKGSPAPPAVKGSAAPPAAPIVRHAAPRDRTIPVLALIAIALGAVLQGVMFALSSDRTLEPSRLLRYALLLILAQYGLVTIIVFGRAAVSNVQARWTAGHAWEGILAGFVVGGAAAAVGVAIVSAVSGRTSTDSRIELFLSEGGVARIGTVVLIVVVAAPLVEEVLFRGLLLESMRTRGRRTAVLLSAFAFAAWHLTPSALPYYMLAGAMLGLLYWRFGLSASIASHAAFNGVLTAAAVLALTGPSHVIEASGVRLVVPAGWQKVEPGDGVARDLVARGPSAASLVVEHLDLPVVPPPVATLADAFRSGRLTPPPNVRIDLASVRVQDYPAGAGMRMTVVVNGRRGEGIFVPVGTRLWSVTIATAGSPRAAKQAEAIFGSFDVKR